MSFCFKLDGREPWQIWGSLLMTARMTSFFLLDIIFSGAEIRAHCCLWPRVSFPNNVTSLLLQNDLWGFWLNESAFLHSLQKRFSVALKCFCIFRAREKGKKLVSVTEWGGQEAALGTGMAKAALGAQWTCLLLFMGLAPGSQLRDGHQLHDLGGGVTFSQSQTPNLAKGPLFCSHDSRTLALVQDHISLLFYFGKSRSHK